MLMRKLVSPWTQARLYIWYSSYFRVRVRRQTLKPKFLANGLLPLHSFFSQSKLLSTLRFYQTHKLINWHVVVLWMMAEDLRLTYSCYSRRYERPHLCVGSPSHPSSREMTWKIPDRSYSLKLSV